MASAYSARNALLRGTRDVWPFATIVQPGIRRLAEYFARGHEDRWIVEGTRHHVDHARPMWFAEDAGAAIRTEMAPDRLAGTTGLSWFISRVGEVVTTFVGCEVAEDFSGPVAAWPR